MYTNRHFVRLSGTPRDSQALHKTLRHSKNCMPVKIKIKKLSLLDTITNNLV